MSKRKNRLWNELDALERMMRDSNFIAGAACGGGVGEALMGPEKRIAEIRAELSRKERP